MSTLVAVPSPVVRRHSHSPLYPRRTTALPELSCPLTGMYVIEHRNDLYIIRIAKSAMDSRPILYITITPSNAATFLHL
jgi:hypothetical protein